MNRSEFLEQIHKLEEALKRDPSSSARSVALWNGFEAGGWNFKSPVGVIQAFRQAAEASIDGAREMARAILELYQRNGCAPTEMQVGQMALGNLAQLAAGQHAEDAKLGREALGILKSVSQ